MSNRIVVCSSGLAFLLPAILGLSCVKRNWDFCAPNAPCKPGFTCTADWQCVRSTDAGSDGLVVIDSRASTEAVGAMDGLMSAVTDGPSDPAVGQDGAGALDSAGQQGVDGRVDGPAAPDTAAQPDVGGGAGAGGTDAPMATGGTGAGGATGSDARPLDVPTDVFSPDAPGTCSTDKDCPTQKPLCLGNLCAKCANDNDCVGRTGPACSTSGLCVACTANAYCKGTAATCDTASSQCVGCAKRSDCSGSCQTCSGSVCVAVKNQDDPTVCAGTCDATGACKSKQGQTCKTSADCVNGLSCADGYCCDKACKGTCEACDVGTAVGTCTTLAANATPRAGRAACVATDATCAGKCDGNSAACAYPPSNTSCGASCAGNSYQPPGTCSNGTCNTPNSQTCTNACVESAGGCVACTPGSYQCLGAQPQKCDSTGTWQNYGSRSCTGSCETCTSSATTATCTNVTTPPSGKFCNGTDATCKGYCSGSSAACTYPDASVACSSSTCSSGTLTTQYCNGAGSCSTVKNQSCGGFPCASGSACSISCTARSTSGCMDGYKCVGGNTCAATAIPCGSGSTTCSTANNGVCCESLPYGVDTTTPWTYSCEPGASCATVYDVRYAASLRCGSKADCPSGQYCCMTGTSCDGTAGGPTPDARCTSDISNCRDGTYNWGTQLCDPSLSPTECLTGTCNSQSCVHGVYTCQ